MHERTLAGQWALFIEHTFVARPDAVRCKKLCACVSVCLRVCVSVCLRLLRDSHTRLRTEARKLTLQVVHAKRKALATRLGAKGGVAQAYRMLRSALAPALDFLKLPG
eukprot:1983523-Alexandrium_andersonii.AAC.1